MGPGGAYGYQSATAAPVPGQSPPPPDAKPRTITQIQVILWIFSAISALSELYSIVSAVRDFSIWTLLAVLVTGYFTVQSLITPVYIERGRRWAWNLTLISATIGATFGLLAAIMILAFPGMPAFVALLALAYAGLYVTLMGLLCSRSAWLWMVLHQNASLFQLQSRELDSGFQTRDVNQRPASHVAAKWFLWFSAFPITVTIGAMIWMIHDHWLREDVMEAVPYYPHSLFTSIVMGLLVVFLAIAVSKPRLWRATAGHFLLTAAVVLHLLLIGWLGLGEKQRVAPTDVFTHFQLAWSIAMILTIVTGLICVVALLLTCTKNSRTWLRKPLFLELSFPASDESTVGALAGTTTMLRKLSSSCPAAGENQRE